jgi:transcriptional regulator with XRE-family HTH domain
MIFMKNFKSDFSNNLYRLRKERGLSQAKLAELSGLSQRVISSYENGDVKPPIDNIEALAKALNVKIEELLKTNGMQKSKNEYLQLDSRTLEKIKIILSLPKRDRHIIYMLAETLLLKAKKTNQDIKD